VTDLLHLPVHGDADIVQARQRVCQAADLLGLGRQDQTRLATAVSEVARVACAAGGGSLRLSLLQAGAHEWSLSVELRHADPVTEVIEQDVLQVVARLVDDLDRQPHGVTLLKHLPGTEHLGDAELEALRGRLQQRALANPLVVLREQNRELAVALALLRERETDLVHLNEELAETNRGVVALYAELESSAEQVRTAQRQVFAELEDALRPPPPDLAGVELAVRYLPAQSNSPTGGDLYDWLVLADGLLHIAVVDVAGHGVESTRTALEVTHALRTLSREGHPLRDLIALTDQLLDGQEAMATVLLGRFDPGTGRMELAGGGHPPALLLADGQPARYVEAPGRPVGYPLAGSDGTTSFLLQDGDTLLLYTDGIIEIRRDIVAGMDLLLACAEQVRGRPIEQLLDDLLSSVQGSAQLQDDTLVLALHRSSAEPTGPAKPMPETRTGTVTTLLLKGEPHSAKAARDHLAAVCAAWELPTRLQDDAQVVVSELVSNACTHVGGAVRLRLQHRPGGLRIEVRDASPRAGFAADPGVQADTGRGLLVVQALASAWGTSVDGDSKTVWAHLDA
jgi:serine phosphatase RsbU (regulator of sigma subunit)/anti-sigma regulatory factor (Ser/Thr protein kinase)